MKDEGSDINERERDSEKSIRGPNVSTKRNEYMVKQRDKSSLNVHANDWMDVLLPGVVVKSQSVTEGARPCKHVHSRKSRHTV